MPREKLINNFVIFLRKAMDCSYDQRKSLIGLVLTDESGEYSYYQLYDKLVYICLFFFCSHNGAKED
jgi:hypothetical protein